MADKVGFEVYKRCPRILSLLKSYETQQLCRRIAKFVWTPTARSVELIKEGLELWNELTAEQREYFYTKKIIKKFPAEEWGSLRQIYDQLGWGFVFDDAEKFVTK